MANHPWGHANSPRGPERPKGPRGQRAQVAKGPKGLRGPKAHSGQATVNVKNVTVNVTFNVKKAWVLHSQR